MRMSLLLTVLFFAGCAPCPCPCAGSGAPTTVTAKGGSQEGGEKDKLVCRRVRVTGSHMKQKVCRYESEWRGDAEAAQKMARPPPAGPGETAE